jgi:ATP-dependent DNA helicase RecQ
MGIDKSNVRYVIHAQMPKSVEAYQQESGRDGLDAECWMFHSSGDFALWKRLIEQSASSNGREGAQRSLQAMSEFCQSVKCRHQALAEYFGRTWHKSECQACDVCLGQLDLVEHAQVIGQKIVSCVLRVSERFGGDYVAKVLYGSQDKRIVANQHDRLSTYGIMSSDDRKAIRDWIEQLATQNYLRREGEYNVLKVTEEGRKLLRSEATPLEATRRGANQTIRNQDRIVGRCRSRAV